MKSTEILNFLIRWGFVVGESWKVTLLMDFLDFYTTTLFRPRYPTTVNFPVMTSFLALVEIAETSINPYISGVLTHLWLLITQPYSYIMLRIYHPIIQDVIKVLNLQGSLATFSCSPPLYPVATAIDCEHEKEVRNNM